MDDRVTMKTLLRALFCVLLPLAQGCLTVADDEGPTLSVEIFWDDEADSEDFRGEDCFGARVDQMEWALWRGLPIRCTPEEEDAGDCRQAESDDDVESYWLVDSAEDSCRDAIDVIDPAPGTYELDLTGYDEAGLPVWATTCSGLTVLRFDVTYECDVHAP